MSALPPKADMVQHNRDVRFVPKADIGWAAQCAGLATQRAESLMGEHPLPGGRKGTFLATRTMHCSRTGENQPGSITVLITWMTPLDCITLLMVISAVSPLASVTQSLPFFSWIVSGPPCTVFSSALPPPATMR
jgi:hypothetical protein